GLRPCLLKLWTRPDGGPATLLCKRRAIARGTAFTSPRKRGEGEESAAPHAIAPHASDGGLGAKLHVKSPPSAAMVPLRRIWGSAGDERRSTKRHRFLMRLSRGAALPRK